MDKDHRLARTVLAYLTAQAGALKTSTLSRRLAAIRAAHELAGAHLDLASSRGFRDLWKSIKREPGTAKAKKAALLTPELRQGIEALPCDALHGLRDRTLLLVGFAGALRRPELVGRHVSEISSAPASTYARRQACPSMPPLASETSPVARRERPRFPNSPKISEMRLIIWPNSLIQQGFQAYGDVTRLPARGAPQGQEPGQIRRTCDHCPEGARRQPRLHRRAGRARPQPGEPGARGACLRRGPEL